MLINICIVTPMKCQSIGQHAAVHNRGTRWDRLSHLHRRITLIDVNRFAAGERASTVALIRYYRVGRANVMKFGSPLGSKGPQNGAAPRERRTYREGVSRRRGREENAFETLVEPDGDGVSRYKHSANQDYVARRYWGLIGAVCFLRTPVCHHAQSTEILPRLSFPLPLPWINERYLKVRSPRSGKPLCMDGERKFP